MLPFRTSNQLLTIVYRFLTLLILFVLPLSFIISTVHAQPADAAGVTQLEQLIVRMIALTSGLAFMALVIMLVYAGIRFITSNGEAKNIQSAQQIVTWAVIGIACLVLAWIILLIIGQFSGLTLNRVCLSFDQCSN